MFFIFKNLLSDWKNHKKNTVHWLSMQEELCNHTGLSQETFKRLLPLE